MTDSVTDHIDETTALSIPELVERTGLTEETVRDELEQLMDHGRITSTPDWKYRLARNSLGNVSDGAGCIEVAETLCEERNDD